jgi:hypothetical protein
MLAANIGNIDNIQFKSWKLRTDGSPAGPEYAIFDWPTICNQSELFPAKHLVREALPEHLCICLVEPTKDDLILRSWP